MKRSGRQGGNVHDFRHSLYLSLCLSLALQHNETLCCHAASPPNHRSRHLLAAASAIRVVHFYRFLLTRFRLWPSEYKTFFHLDMFQANWSVMVYPLILVLMSKGFTGPTLCKTPRTLKVRSLKTGLTLLSLQIQSIALLWGKRPGHLWLRWGGLDLAPHSAATEEEES